MQNSELQRYIPLQAKAKPVALIIAGLLKVKMRYLCRKFIQVMLKKPVDNHRKFLLQVLRPVAVGIINRMS